MKRIVPGLALAACWLFLLLKGTFFQFWLVTLLIASLGSHEYLKMALKDDECKRHRFILTCILIFPVLFTGLFHLQGLCAGTFFALFMAVCFTLFIHSHLANSFNELCKLFFGIIYVGFLTSHLLLLYHYPEGNYWLIILVAITAGSDSGAYFFGKSFGRHKLCPGVSPNKTIEGAVGGLISGVFVALIFSWILLQNVNWFVVTPVAVLLTGVGIIGDLCESVVKRGTDTKDSGKILLGHGGILDRIDSMILAAPLLYYLLIFTG